MKKPTFFYLLLSGAAFLLLTACPKTPELNLEELTAKAWLLESLNGEPAGLGMNKQPRWVQFATDGKVNGFGGCNNFMGSYEFEGDRVQLGNLSSTMMACPGEFSDDLFLAALENAETISMKNGQLLLKQNGNTLATLAPREPHLLGSAELKNTRWVLRQVNNHTFQLPEGGKELFIQFPLGEENTVNGYTGCNRIMGGVTIDGPTLQFGNLASTSMACGPEQNKLENEVQEALRKVESYQILGERLILKGEGRRLAVFEAVYL